MQRLENTIGIILNEKFLERKEDRELRFLKTSRGMFLLKKYKDQHASERAKAEVNGLETLRNTNTVAVPELLFYEEGENFFVVQFIEPHFENRDAEKQLGKALKKLHQVTKDSFGFATDNFIGDLPQANGEESDWPSFYWSKRIEPSMQQILAKGWMKEEDFVAKEQLKEGLQKWTDGVAPALLHGDLWSGNVVYGRDKAYVIDPAVYYGDPLVDIAMMHLFKGLKETTFEAYWDGKALPPYYEKRIACYQYYYILVHVNLFGESYVAQAKELKNTLNS